MKFQKFHFMNGTMCATSSKKKMTAILLGLTLALAPYGMTGAEAAAKSTLEKDVQKLVKKSKAKKENLANFDSNEMKKAN